jgi:PIN domain nuclease of toxin-antitoxin system
VIVLDTHVWVWWIHATDRLSARDLQSLDAAAADGLGVSIISCWEIAKLVEYGRLRLPGDLEQWLQQALAHPGIQLLGLTPRIVVESTRLPAPFHRDPADQLIVATARVHGIPVATADDKILLSPHVETLCIGGNPPTVE